MNDVGLRGLLGVRIGSNDLQTLLTVAMSHVVERTPPFTFACANPHSLVVAQSDRHFRAALQECSAVVADGVGVTIAGRIAGADVGPRITGEDFFLGFMAQMNRRGGRIFLLGSTDAVLDRMVQRAHSDYPNLHVAAFSPPFGDWDDSTNTEIVARIRAASPDVLWVGMTAPKQEKWVYANARNLAVPVIGSIGAVFGFYAQTAKRAPALLCSAGLEWLYRLLHEPRRLWKRTLISAPAFLWLVFRERLFIR